VAFAPRIVVLIEIHKYDKYLMQLSNIGYKSKMAALAIFLEFLFT
jgi:hypothetical protein